MNKKFMVLFLLIIILAGFGFFIIKEENKLSVYNDNTSNLNYDVNVRIGSNNIKVKIADTASLQVQGLSGTQSMQDDQGMLFIFDEVSPKFFWMKDMNFPIDIIWISPDNKIVGVQENALPESFPTSFASPANTKYVLEVNANYFKNHNLKIGDKVEMSIN